MVNLGRLSQPVSRTWLELELGLGSTWQSRSGMITRHGGIVLHRILCVMIQETCTALMQRIIFEPVLAVNPAVMLRRFANYLHQMVATNINTVPLPVSREGTHGGTVPRVDQS